MPGNRWPSSPARVSASSLRTSDAAGEFGEDGEQAGSGRRLQHEIGRRDRGGGAGREAERDRRRELLKRLALLGAARVGGEKARDLGQHRQHGGGRRGPRAHGRAEFAQEQHRRRLAGVVGGLPVPGALGVGTAEGGVHRGAERRRIDALAAFEMGKDASARHEPARRPVAGAGGATGSGAAAKAAAEAGFVRHGGNLGRAGTGRAEGRSLSTPPAQTRPGHPLPLGTSKKKRVRR